MEVASLLEQVRPELPMEIIEGLVKKDYERVGGLVLETASQCVMALIRGTGLTEGVDLSTALPSLPPGVLVASQLAGLGQAAPLALSMASMEFKVVREKLQQIEKKLDQVQSLLAAAHYKLDLAFYANFQAALKLAQNAFIMQDIGNRQAMAREAIARFLEAEHYYSELCEKELTRGGHVATDLLFTLFLAYVSEARCYLELEEAQAARRRLAEARVQLRSWVCKVVETMLTSNPAVYLCPALTGKVDLDRLTHCLQWLDPKATPGSVFNDLRDDLWRLARDEITEPWFDSLPLALWDPQVDAPKGRGGKPKKVNIRQKTSIVLSRLPDALRKAEVAIETSNRFHGFEKEVQFIAQERIGFQEWQDLLPLERAQEQPFACVLLPEPVPLAV
jgi:hypothetical protein